MSDFPNNLDDDTTLPPVSNNITEIGEELLNNLRDAIFKIEESLGQTLTGSTTSLSERLDVSIRPDGYIKPSSLTGIGLVALPITNSQVSATAAIEESKLDLL